MSTKEIAFALTGEKERSQIIVTWLCVRISQLIYICKLGGNVSLGLLQYNVLV
jgi:hypothetical protein